MPTISVIESKDRLLHLMDEVAMSHEPILITSKHSNAVLISEDDWRAIAETLHLLSIPGMRESILEGIDTPLEECTEDLEW